jgi:hypothetical protein
MITKVFTTQENKIRDLLEDKFDFGLQGRWALISIYRNPEKPIIKNEDDIKVLRSKGCTKVLSVCFGDYTDTEYKLYVSLYKTAPKHINIITKVQACSIVRFIRRLPKQGNIKTLVVQCKAGISRSGAVGLYALRIYGLNENEFMRSGLIRPNFFIYSMLSKIYNPIKLITKEPP